MYKNGRKYCNMNEKRTTLRINSDLKEDLKKLAALDKRSLNTIMEIALEQFRDREFQRLGLKKIEEDK